mgnify:CR=1 FL=1
MKINLNKQVFDKEKFLDTVDINFNQLVQPPVTTFFDRDLATVEDFFYLYDKLFLDIPKQGAINSHFYIVTRSGEYIDFEKDTTDIDALLREISELRIENLNLQKSLTNAQIKLSTLGQTLD